MQLQDNSTIISTMSTREICDSSYFTQFKRTAHFLRPLLPPDFFLGANVDAGVVGAENTPPAAGAAPKRDVPAAGAGAGVTRSGIGAM